MATSEQPITESVPEVSSDERMHVLDETCWCKPWIWKHPDGSLTREHSPEVLGSSYAPRDYQQERDDLAARLAEAEARADEAEARFERYREQFREITFEGMSLADWHTKHCAAQQVAVEAEATLARVEAELAEQRDEGGQPWPWVAHIRRALDGPR